MAIKGNEVRIRNVKEGIYQQSFVYISLIFLSLSDLHCHVCKILLSFSVWPIVPSHCRYRGLLLHLVTLNDTHTHTHTHTVGRTPLDEGSADSRVL